MDKRVKAEELLHRIKKSYGVNAEIEDGIVVLYDSVGGDLELQEAVAKQLLKFLPEVRIILQQRATAARGRRLIGRRIFTAEQEQSEGRLHNVSDGKLIVSINLGFSTNASTVTADPSQLVVWQEAPPEQSSPAPETAAIPANAQAGAEKPPRRRLLDLIGDTLTGGKEK